ncbi:MAG: PorT family protein [Bacteroidales bacterium]|nr:PorT family protein [Bacteroidales bacterium]
MKKIIVVIVAMLLAAPAFSQFNWGIKGGLSTTDLAIDQTLDLGDGSIVLEQAKEASYGFHGGLFVRLTVLGIYIQPEILFTSAENKIKITDVGAATAEIRTQSFNKLDIPVLVGFKLGPLRINAGPAATIKLSSPKELFDTQNYENLYKSATFGYQAGIGVDLLKKLTLDLRYEGNLNQFGNELTVGGETFALDQRSSAFVFSVGLLF